MSTYNLNEISDLSAELVQARETLLSLANDAVHNVEPHYVDRYLDTTKTHYSVRRSGDELTLNHAVNLFPHVKFIGPSDAPSGKDHLEACAKEYPHEYAMFVKLKKVDQFLQNLEQMNAYKLIACMEAEPQETK